MKTISLEFYLASIAVLRIMAGYEKVFSTFARIQTPGTKAHR
jgi:hypothetical protein